MEEDEGIHENRKLGEKKLKEDNEKPDLLDAKKTFIRSQSPTPKRRNLFRSYSEVLADWGCLFLAK